jgi:L-rhamnose mutarotase
MRRIAYLLRIREGKQTEYISEHRNVWPELIELIKTVGFRNYTIFQRDLNLFVYVEVDDFQKSLRDLTSFCRETVESGAVRQA